MTDIVSADGNAAAIDTLQDTPIEKNSAIGSSNCSDDDLVSDDVTACPDFSKLKGRVCLDSLSVRELQQTFRATFGRITAVKDKLWLKRRIVMGLTNSCQIPNVPIFIENEKVVEMRGLDENGVVDGECVAGDTHGGSSDLEQQRSKEVCERVNISNERAASVALDYDVRSDGLRLEDTVSKRVRKPTKRYIEELSEVEPQQVDGSQSPSVKTSLRVPTTNTSQHSSIKKMYPDAKTGVMLLDAFGGGRIQVPFGSRVRRSRPRENISSLLLNFSEENRKSPVPAAIKSLPIVAPSNKPMDSVPSTYDDDQNLVPSLTAEISRKHHRAWTLSEVMKLVEGVSRFGAGKWSEIKRLSFTSYPYRSSVDLKDKWRNLLRVSFADSSRDNNKMSSRKQTQTPLPAPILSKVRELAERQGQIPPISAKKISSIERGPGSGFL